MGGHPLFNSPSISQRAVVLCEQRSLMKGRVMLRGVNFLLSVAVSMHMFVGFRSSGVWVRVGNAWGITAPGAGGNPW